MAWFGDQFVTNLSPEKAPPSQAPAGVSRRFDNTIRQPSSASRKFETTQHQGSATATASRPEVQPQHV